MGVAKNSVAQNKQLIDHYIGLMQDTDSETDRATYLAYIIECNSQIERVTGEPYVLLEDIDEVPKYA
jgi:hypothetical protein